MPELRIDPLSRAARDRRRRARRPAGRVHRTSAGGPAGRPRVATRSSRATRTGRRPRSTPCGRTAARPTRPGWRVRVVPNMFPALAAGDGAADDPLACGRGRAGAVRRAARRPERTRWWSTARSRSSSLLDLGPDGLATAMGVWRERIRAHAEAAYVHVIVNEGQEAGASLPHTHAQLYALAVRARRGRTRARALHRLPRPHPGPEPARRRGPGGGQAPRAAGGGGRRGGGHLPVRRARAVPRADRAARARPPGSRTTGPLAPRCCTTCCGGWPPSSASARRSTSGCAPPRAAPSTFCWRIDLLPRLAHPAGLEMGAGIQLCVLAPEGAAERLRQVE